VQAVTIVVAVIKTFAVIEKPLFSWGQKIPFDYEHF